MPRVHLCSILALASLTACPAPCPVCPAAPKPRLYTNEDGRPYIADAPSGAHRASFFYVHAAVPLPHTSTEERIGIFQGSNRYGNVLEGDWYCRPEAPFDASPAKGGLPVLHIGQDTELRVKHCMGHHVPGSKAEWDEREKNRDSFVDLTLDLGKSDGVREGEEYEVLGSPQFESVNHAITGFDLVGRCRVEQLKVGDHSAVCRLDRMEWGKFTLDVFKRGGQVRLKPKEQP